MTPGAHDELAAIIAGHEQEPTPLELYLHLLQFVQAMNDHNKERNARIEALEQKIDRLEDRPALTDKGLWTHGQPYGVGAVVTKQGSAWVCTKAHFSTGSMLDHSCFRLLFKSAQR